MARQVYNSADRREEQVRRKKRVVVLHTGGTIFMHQTERGRDTAQMVVPQPSASVEFREVLAGGVSYTTR